MSSSEKDVPKRRHSLLAMIISSISGMFLGAAIYSIWLFPLRSLSLLATMVILSGFLCLGLMLAAARIMSRLTGMEWRKLEVPEAMATSSLLLIYLSFILSFLTLTVHEGKEIYIALAAFFFINLLIFLMARGHRVVLLILSACIIAGILYAGIYVSKERVKFSPLPKTGTGDNHTRFRVHHGYHTRTGFWLDVNQSIETNVAIAEKNSLRFEIGVVFPGKDLAPARLLVMAKDSKGKVIQIDEYFINRERLAWRTLRADLSGLSPGNAVIQLQLYSIDEEHENLKPLVISNFTIFPIKNLSKGKVVLLVLDALRADALGCYGSGQTHTPVMDRLAGQGVLFEKALTPCTWTIPSVASLLTSRLPSQHGAMSYFRFLHDRKIQTLPEILTNQGILTKAIIGNWLLHSRLNFDKGFNDYYLEPLSRVLWRSTESVMNDSVEWIRSNSGQPFFAYIHNMDPHHPHLAPEPYSFGPGHKSGFKKFLEAVVTAFRTPYIYGLSLSAVDALNDSEVEDMRERYLGEVQYVDSQVAEIESVLKSNGLWDDTLFIITSDHGEEFQEHGTLRHGQDLHREVLRVPLIFTGGAIKNRGRRVSSPVSLLDLYPTILEFFDVPVPPDILGQSLWPLIQGGEDEDRVVFSELVEPLEHRHLFMSAVKGDYHFIKKVPLRAPEEFKLHSQPDIKLYRWDKDPEEQHDLSSAHADMARELEQAVDEFFDSLQGKKRLDMTYQEGLEEIQKRLRALGYLK